MVRGQGSAHTTGVKGQASGCLSGSSRVRIPTSSVKKCIEQRPGLTHSPEGERALRLLLSARLGPVGDRSSLSEETERGPVIPVSAEPVALLGPHPGPFVSGF